MKTAYNCDKSGDRALWCSGCRSKKRCFNSEYEVKSNIFEEQVHAIYHTRASKARDFYEPETFWSRSLPEISKQCGNFGLMDAEAEKLTKFQVEML